MGQRVNDCAALDSALAAGILKTNTTSGEQYDSA